MTRYEKQARACVCFDCKHRIKEKLYASTHFFCDCYVFGEARTTRSTENKPCIFCEKATCRGYATCNLYEEK